MPPDFSQELLKCSNGKFSKKLNLYSYEGSKFETEKFQMKNNVAPFKGFLLLKAFLTSLKSHRQVVACSARKGGLPPPLSHVSLLSEYNRCVLKA